MKLIFLGVLDSVKGSHALHNAFVGETLDEVVSGFIRRDFGKNASGRNGTNGRNATVGGRKGVTDDFDGATNAVSTRGHGS